MYRPPPISDFRRYPATSGAAVLAVLTTVWWWSGANIDAVTMSYRAWEHGEVWRLVTSALPHVDLLHLAFNLYWLWIFGSVMEREWGVSATAGAMLLLATGSAAAEHAFFVGGVGLSGVGYGLFGFMWLAGHRQARFREVLDPTLIKFFIGWFVLCIVLTAMNVWPVANVAHGVGALLGLLLAGATTTQYTRPRIAWSAALVALTISCGAGSAIGRPHLNIGHDGGQDLAIDGLKAFQRGDPEAGVRLYERAVRISDGHADWWYNLGVGHYRLGAFAEARRAYERAVELDPSDTQYREALRIVDGPTLDSSP